MAAAAAAVAAEYASDDEHSPVEKPSSSPPKSRAVESSSRQRRRQSCSSLPIDKSIRFTKIHNQEVSMAAAAATAAQYFADDEPSNVEKPSTRSHQVPALSSARRRRLQSLSSLSVAKSALLAEGDHPSSFVKATSATSAQCFAEDVPSTVEKQPSTTGHRVVTSSSGQRRRQSLSSLPIESSMFFAKKSSQENSMTAAAAAAAQFFTDDEPSNDEHSSTTSHRVPALSSANQRRRQSLSSLSIEKSILVMEENDQDASTNLSTDKNTLVMDGMDQAHPAPRSQAMLRNKQRRRKSLPTNSVRKMGILWMEHEDDEASPAVAPSAPRTTRKIGTGHVMDNPQQVEAPSPVCQQYVVRTARRIRHASDNSAVRPNAGKAKPLLNGKPPRRRSTAGYTSSKSDVAVSDDGPSQTGELLEDWSINICAAVASDEQNGGRRERLISTRKQHSFEQGQSTKRSLLKLELLGSL